MGGRISQTSTSSADTKEVKSAKTQIIPVLGKHILCLFCTEGPYWSATAPFIFRHHEESSNSQVFIIFLPEILLMTEIFVFLFLLAVGIEKVNKKTLMDLKRKSGRSSVSTISHI